MAGTHPGVYLETLKHFGTALSPEIAICMLYEGNDFRDSNYEREDTIVHKVGDYLKSSPLRLALLELMIKNLGPSESKAVQITSASQGDNNDSEKETVNSKVTSALSWLPVPIPGSPEAKYYTFTVKNLCAHFETKESFLRTEGCKETLASLRQIKKICKDNNILLTNHMFLCR